MASEPKLAQRAGQVLECPKCQKSLAVASTDGVEIDTCASCNGTWVDHIEEKQVLQVKPAVFSVDELRRLRKFYTPLGRTEPVRYVPCPICKKLMNRKIWGSYSGVVVDVCSDHGTWYDAKELEKVKEYVELGGIEYEKMGKMDQGFSDINSKLVQEVTRLDKRIYGAYARARIFSLIGL